MLFNMRVAKVSRSSTMVASLLVAISACTDKSTEGQLTDAAVPYAAALCDCWQLFDFGDLFFSSKQECMDVGPSIGAGLLPWDAACALPIYENNLSESQQACIAKSMERAAACLQDLGSCSDDQYEAYGNCAFEISGISDCARPSDSTLDEISLACSQ